MLARIEPAIGFNEPCSSLSHFLGAVLFAILGVVLLRRGRGDRLRMAALCVYVASLLFQLVMSGLFHLVDRGTTLHRVIACLDYTAIFILIAGTGTPPQMILFRGIARWGPLGFIWAVAIVGATLKILYFDNLSHGICVALFLAMGWTGAVAGYVTWRRYGTEFVKPLFGGALAYTVGAICEVNGSNLTLWSGFIEGHEIWHIAVLVGAALHWAFIYQFASGALPPVIARRPSRFTMST